MLMNNLLSVILSNSDQFSLKTIRDLPQMEVSGITHDSREVIRGNIFVALTGKSFDGHAYIQEAIDNGAAVVIGESRESISEVPYLQIENSRLALAHLAAAFYEFPGRKLTVIGVTGTDGKTTTVNLIHNILVSCGIKTGMISTVNEVIGDEKIETGFQVITPEEPKIQKLLCKMVKGG